MPLRSSTFAAAAAAVAIVAAATAVWLFPRALPIVALEQSVTRDVALARADSFFRAHELAPAGAHTAVRFRGNDSLRTFVELAGGGHDSLNALVRGRDVAPFIWSVRAFVPRDPREARVDFAPDGRIVGFDRKLAESDRRPAVAPDSGQRLAELALSSWTDERRDRWHLVSSSYETRKTSGRIDRTYTFERVNRRVGGAPIRADVVIAGDIPVRVRPFVEIPESFRRRYGEMRSANQLLSLIASLGILVVAIAGIVFLSRSAKAKKVRWTEPLTVGMAIGALALLAGLNEMPGSWFTYDTATSPASFQAFVIVGAMAAGAITALIAGITLAVAESATRQAFPRHLDWWKLWTYRGTKEVASRVAGGYAASAIAFAYVAIFYLVTRRLFGWWVPSELLDDPNQIASPMPWISGIAVSLNAGVWEEALFRALPLSLLSLWVGTRRNRKLWLAAGVVVAALIFGFAHSDYASWPPYSRGVEIFLDACFWGVLFLNFGILVTVVAHFVYDLVLFGLFAASGNAPEYRITAAIIVLALLAPALSVLWKFVRQRGLIHAPDDAFFAAWTPATATARVEAPFELRARVLTTRTRQLAFAAALVGAVVAVARPPKRTLGPEFTADRERVVAVSDSVLGSRGGDPSAWKRLTNTATDTLAAWPRYLRDNKLVPQAQRYASAFHPAAWWIVRYAHTGGTAADRAEEWRVRLWPDGRLLDIRHLVPDSARRPSVGADDVRRVARAALARAGVDTATLQEAEFKETARPARRDVTVTYTDTSVKLPGGAVARAWVQVAGDEPLVARRGVELPESFLRADRERQTNRSMIAGMCGLLLLGGIITGAIVVIRRRPVLLDDVVLDRRSTLITVGVLVALAALDRLNTWPTLLFSYDTTEPWSRFFGTTITGFIGAIPLSLFVLGAWLTLDALRRRVGIPMLAGAPSRAASNDMLIAGIGLGGLVYAMTHFDPSISKASMPHAPTTLLAHAWPFVERIPGIPAAAVMTVVVIAVPVLVVAGLTRRWSMRALIAAAIAALVLAAGLAYAPRDDLNPLGLALVIPVVALVGFAFYAWGTASAWSWFVAALASAGLSGVRMAVYAPTTQEKIAGMLGALVSGVLIAAIAGGAQALSRQVHSPQRTQRDAEETRTVE